MRYVGLGLISFAIFVFGFTSSRRLSETNKIRASLILLIREIKSGILMSKPLSKIYADFNDTYLEKIGFLDELAEKTDKPLLGAVGGSRKKKLLTSEEQSELSAFAERVGLFGDTEAEAERCSRLLNLLEAKKADLEKENSKRSVLALKLGILGAAVVWAAGF